MSKIVSPKVIDNTAAITLLDTQKKPVLFWDTCSFLDVIRIPLPERSNSIAVLENVIEIKNKIVNNNIICISSVLCITEFNNHIEKWVKEVELSAQKISKLHNNYIGFVNKLNLGTIPISSVDVSMYKLEDLLLNLVHAIIAETYFIEENISFANFAHFRTVNKVPPAKKKGEYKDCYIWGTCLEIKRTTTDNSYPYYFLSSNTTDYAAPNKIDFVTEIANEASLANIKYFPSFKYAFGKLREGGIL